MKDPCVELLHEQLIIKGRLTRETVEDRLAACETCFPLPQAFRTLVINFSAVTECDSASLAFLTALYRIGKQKQVEIKFMHLPEKLLALARVCEVERMLLG